MNALMPEERAALGLQIASGPTTAYPNHVVEMAFIGNEVEAAYRRVDLFAKRVVLAADWAGSAHLPPVGETATRLR